jgi:glycogen debranching enzyme
VAELTGLDEVLAPEGWTYASAPPVEPGDPGRFHALFGRDSLITALQLLPVRPELARDTLRAHARLQGTLDDPQTDEEPGKIVHEYRQHAPDRFEYLGWPVRDGELRYYGSADSTCWFLVLLAALGDSALADELAATWRAAGGWIERALEHGEGFVTYGPRLEPGGLVQQGWRDTPDPLKPYGGGILRADGAVPEPPLADADVQAVAFVALRALRALSGEERFDTMAAELGERVTHAFGPDTMAIEAGGRPVEGAGSQLGWLLWSGVLEKAAAARVAERLSAPDVLTGFGLRTLSERHPAFEPDAYHRGSVWPFDSWLGYSGLRGAAREAEAEAVRTGVLAAISRLGRAPELYAVDTDGPRPIPISNRVQAWTVGARWALEERWDGRPALLFR